jgi:hypothetical protein
MRSKVLILIFLITIPILSFSQYKNRKSKSHRDFPTISIGPEAGGIIAYGGNLNKDAKIYFNYSFGSFLILRPFQRFGLESELNYGKWVKSYSYYEIPILFQVYNQSDIAFKFGPLLNFPNVDENSVYSKDLQLGLRIGAGNQFTGFYVDFSKNRLLEKTASTSSSFMIGFGLKLRVGLINF